MPDFTSEDRAAAIAEILDDDGRVIDLALSWETAQSMALSEGYRVRVLRGDGHMSADEIQRLCDAERARYRDCYGLES